MSFEQCVISSGSGWKPVPTIVIIGTLTVYSSLGRERIFLCLTEVFVAKGMSAFTKNISMVEKRIDGG